MHNLEEKNQNSANMKSTDNQQEYNKKLSQTLRWPLVAYGTLGGLYAAFLPGKWVWFSYHPLGMAIAFVALAGNAALIKKVKGYDNTKIHGYLMSAATACAGFAYYVIYSNKETYSKPHLTTIHGKLGFAVMLGYTSLAIFGALALHPDFGIMRTNPTVRFAHKWSGRIMTAAAWISCVLGFMTMQKNVYFQALFGAPLLVAGLYVLL